MDKEQIEERFENRKELVRKVLEEKEEARNSDRFLIWFIWTQVQELDLNKFSQGGFLDAYNAETIRRVRAEIQNNEEELLPTDPEVIKSRKIKEDVVRGYYGAGSQTYGKYRKLKDDS